jgi:hypothetical protein
LRICKPVSGVADRAMFTKRFMSQVILAAYVQKIGNQSTFRIIDR